MIIFGSILTAAGAVLQIGLSLKPNHHQDIYLPKSMKLFLVPRKMQVKFQSL
jgi:hypothetical protein